MKFLRLIAALLPFLASAQNVMRTVPTIADLLSAPPATYAESLPGTNAVFHAHVKTSGDTAPGQVSREWWWDKDATDATNTIDSVSGPGPFAWPTDQSGPGRWLLVPDGSYSVNRTMGGIVISNGGRSWYNGVRSLSYPMFPLAQPNSVIGRRDGSGTGDFESLFFSPDFDTSDGVVRLDPSVLASINNSDVGVAESMADLVTAVSSTQHVSMYYVKSYYSGRYGMGDGWWNWFPNSERVPGRAVVASAKGGRMLPLFPDGHIDVTMFGAVTKGSSSINDVAFQEALSMQQDRTIGGILFVPIGDFPILSSLRKKSIGSAGVDQGVSFTVNNVGGYPIGTTTMLVDNVVGTPLLGDILSINGIEYRFSSYNSGSGQLVIASPGLTASVADNAVITDTARNYQVNQSLIPTGYGIGATNISVDTGSRTILPGDVVAFDTTTETTQEYRVVAFIYSVNGTGTLQIAHPGLRDPIADNAVVRVVPAPRLAIVGQNHGITQDQFERAQTTSNIIMETDNTPIVELGGFHNLIQNLTLQYDSFQTSSDTASACIFNPSSQRLYQNVISGVSMHRGAYGIHVQSGTATAPNNWFYNILVETASISDIYYDKSGTENWGGGWYLQQLGQATTGAGNHSKSIVNVTKSGNRVTLTVTDLPDEIQEGAFIDVTGLDTQQNGQFSVISASGVTIVYDVDPTYTAAVTDTTGTVQTVVKSRLTNPVFYNIAQWDITGLDTEATKGPLDPNVPICVHNVGGKLSINGMHMEYIVCDQNRQSILKNNGGTLTIQNVDIINSGRLQGIDVNIFENTTGSGAAANSAAGNYGGHVRVGIFGCRDMSLNSGGSGNWILSTNRATTDAVWFGDYHFTDNIRENTTNRLHAGTSETSARIPLVIP